MAVIDETTSHLALPLPHPSNSLEDDVLRLRTALNGIDTKIQALDALLASDDISLDTLQELVTAIKGDASNLLAHIGAGGTVHAAATGSAAGFMSAADKTALDGHIGSGGTAHANATGSTAGFMSAADKTALDGHIGSGGASHAAATGSANGFMSAADKTKLDGVTLGVLLDVVEITPASDGQTAFTVAGGYTPGSILVLLNGVKLASADYTATTSPNLTLTVGANTTDLVEVVRFKRALSA